jgi:hypothetical protein
MLFEYHNELNNSTCKCYLNDKMHMITSIKYKSYLNNIIYNIIEHVDSP